MVPVRLLVTTPKTDFRRPRHVRRVVLILLVFLLSGIPIVNQSEPFEEDAEVEWIRFCLLYTSPSPRDKRQSRMPSSA